MTPSQVSCTTRLSLVDLMLIEVDEALADRSRGVPNRPHRPDPPGTRSLPCSAIEETSPASVDIEYAASADNSNSSCRTSLAAEIVQELTRLIDGQPNPDVQNLQATADPSRSSPSTREKALGANHATSHRSMSPPLSPPYLSPDDFDATKSINLLNDAAYTMTQDPTPFSLVTFAASRQLPPSQASINWDGLLPYLLVKDEPLPSESEKACNFDKRRSQGCNRRLES